MTPELNVKYLITTEELFYAPDGNLYGGVFGTVTDVLTDEETLGIKTNRLSTNWYIVIGNMVVAGCQIKYAIQTDTINLSPRCREIEYEDKLSYVPLQNTEIYCSDV